MPPGGRTAGRNRPRRDESPGRAEASLDTGSLPEALAGTG